MTLFSTFIGGIIFAVVALIAVILYNSIEFINSNRWPQDGTSPVGGHSIRNPKTEYNEKDS